MMQYTELYSDSGLSYFKDVEVIPGTEEALGFYSQPYNVSSLIFRQSRVGDFFNWHVAPQTQYIVYLSGKVELQASGGQTKVFKQGDILLANDTEGKGHITKVIEESTALVLR